jgi:ankyrin repeat protein
MLNLYFISASKKGNENIVSFLINNGCNISEKNKDGKTGYDIGSK